MWFAAVGMAVNVAGSLLLFPVYQHVGIAIASSLAGWINAILLAGTLMKRKDFQIDSLLGKRLALLLAASGIMGAAVYFGAKIAGAYLYHDLLFTRAAALAVLVGFGVMLYAVLCQITGAANFLSFAKRLRRRGP